MDPSTFDCRNMGDVSMLIEALARLTAVFPSARLRVLTDDPERLARFCPDVEPLSHSGRREWVSDQSLGGAIHHHLPEALGTAIEALNRSLRRRFPSGLEALLHGKARLRRRDDGMRRAFRRALAEADLFVVSGAMTLTDKAAAHARIVLDTLDTAMARGTPTAMMSQGVGPMRTAPLLEHARRVLPRVNLIALREGVFGPQRLAALGVRENRLVVTGDDAVPLAVRRPATAPGPNLGLNIRVARSSEADAGVLPFVREAVRSAVRRHGASVIPLPIAFHAAADDPRFIRELLSDLDAASDGGQGSEDPGKLIDDAGRCRLVVTGAYHAAVFAMAQGVPVVALAANEDYREKFAGLADQFGVGCRVVSLTGRDLACDLGAAIDAGWEEADRVRPLLREAAQRQASAGSAAYARLTEIVSAAERAA